MIADFVALCFLPLSAADAAALGRWVAHTPCLECGFPAMHMMALSHGVTCVVCRLLMIDPARPLC